MIKKLFGKRIKELRTKENLTQEQLAEILNIGERNLSKIECGVNFVSAETLEKLSEALKVPFKDLFDFEHLRSEEFKKDKLLEAINNNDIDIELLYRIYKALKK